MTVSHLSATQTQRFIRICEDQGIKVTKTKKGLLLRFPDGSSTVQHFTVSDSRGMQNQIAKFRRAGMTHPNDPRGPKDLPTYITSGTISKKTRERIIDLMKQLDYPEAVLSSTVVKETGMDPGWANRALYHSGFRPGPAKNKRVGRPWYTPDEILELKDKPKADEAAETPMSHEEAVQTIDEQLAEVIVEAEEEHEEAIETEGPLEKGLLSVAMENTALATDDYAEPDVSRETSEVPQEVIDHIDFIDERDSWTVDLRDLLGEHLHRMVSERLDVLGVVGIEYEFRVWRKK